MATFNPDVQKTNDPSYMGASQGTDRAQMQNLASVPELNTRPVSVDYKANTSVGNALKGLGESIDVSVKGVDGIIKKSIETQINDGVERIRDSFGVAQAVQLSNGVALEAGKAGQEGQLLPANTSNPAVNRLGNKIEGLTEAYQQGQLSNSYYYARLESFVRETKAQNPGYAKEIDQMISEKVGTTPANALRSSLLQDVTALQNKATAAADKWTQFERTNIDAILMVDPQYYDKKAKGIEPNKIGIEAGVARLRAEDYAFDRDSKRITNINARDGIIGSDAERVLGDRGLALSNRMFSVATNGVNADAMRQTINTYLANPEMKMDPKVRADLTGKMALLEQQFENQWTGLISSRISENSSLTWASAIKNPERLKQLKEQAFAPIAALKAGLLDNQIGLVTAQKRNITAMEEGTENTLLAGKGGQAILATNVIQKRLGDQPFASLLMSSAPLRNHLLHSMEQLNLEGFLTGQKTVQGVFEEAKGKPGSPDKVTDGAFYQRSVQLPMFITQNPDKYSKEDREAASTALYGPGNNRLLLQVDYASRPAMFADMFSDKATKAHKDIGGQAYSNYKEQANKLFTDLFQDQVNTANNAATNYGRNQNMRVEYNPQTSAFEYKGGWSTPRSQIEGANAQLRPLNTAIQLMTPIYKADGKDVNAQVEQVLMAAGIEPGTPLAKALTAAIKKDGGDDATEGGEGN